MDQTVITHELACAVCAAMGTGWTFENKDEHAAGTVYAPRFVHADGHGFYLCSRYNSNGKVEVSPVWPKGSDGKTVTYYPAVYGGPNTHEIKVSVSRGADAIAADIKKRFLPVYLPMWQNAADVRNRNDAYSSLTKATVAELVKSELFTNSARDDSPKVLYTKAKGAYSVNVSGGFVSFEVSGVTPEKAIAILQLLSE